MWGIYWCNFGHLVLVVTVVWRSQDRMEQNWCWYFGRQWQRVKPGARCTSTLSPISHVHNMSAVFSVYCSKFSCHPPSMPFLARGAFVRMNRHAIATMFVRLFVRPSVCLSRMGMHCDYAVHLSADLSLWLDILMFWTPWHQSMPTYSQHLFPISPGREVGYG